MFLYKAMSVIRDNFYGRVTYAAGLWENVNWNLFDIIGVAYYRDILNHESFHEDLDGYFINKKPVVILEYGCPTGKGAAIQGELWMGDG